MTASASASDATSGLAQNRMRVRCGPRKRAGSNGSSATVEVDVDIDLSGCRAISDVADVVGHTRTRELDARLRLTDAAKGSSRLEVRGTWRQSKSRASVRRTILTTTRKGARLIHRFHGAQVGIVARRGPQGGRFDVIVDGDLVETVDLYAPTRSDRRLVFVHKVPRGGEHVLRIKATGQGSAESNGTKVWIDAIVTLDRRK